MAIEGLKIGQNALKSIGSIGNASNNIAGNAKQTGNKTESFADLFADAVKDVDNMQKDADKQIEGLVKGEGVSTHDAMIALEKADIAFQLMNSIRGKIVRAYEEVMRTQV
jgi:flagellar hook-basal body complex protein FliE